MQGRSEPDHRVPGHWLIYLQLIKYFLPKTAQDDWFLFGLGLTEVLIGSVTNQGDMVGAWLLFWAMLAVWVLGLFFLQREARRFQTESTAIALPSPVAKDDPYFGLFDVPYLAASLRVLSLTLLLGGFFFLLLPRQAGETRARSSGTMSKHLTGFDEEVALGQLGEILENDSVVMSVEFVDEDRKAIRPVGEPLWRGVTLIHYENGRWRRMRHHSLQTIVSMSVHDKKGANHREHIRQIIKLEPNDSATLFGIRPVLEAAGRRINPYMDPVDGTLYRAESRGGYDYEILSDNDPDGPQESEMIPSEAAIGSLREMPVDLRTRFREIALPVIGGRPGRGPRGDRARARALEGFLSDSGRFSYTLQMGVVDRRLDPVEDFLVNRKQGHCEYFASGLALLLRSIDIPARMVNGFKGGDWNELTQSMNVRQKHAHSWVEAYVGQDESNRPRWVTLDPTPGLERDASVARVGGIAGNVRSITDMIRYVWVFYILGYDSNRQNRLLYAPLKTAILAVREGYATLWELAKKGVARLFDFQNLASFVSVKGFIVSFIVLSLLVGLVKLTAWLGRQALQWWHGPTDDSSGLTAGVLFYRRLVQLLAPYDLERTTAETQNEFALRATRFLTGQGMQTLPVADVPQKIVDAYYRVRFGHRDLDPESLRGARGKPRPAGTPPEHPRPGELSRLRPTAGPDARGYPGALPEASSLDDCWRLSL